MNLAYEYGQTLAKTAAEPWSVLRAGLTHGALSAIPGAAIGGALGYGTAPEEYDSKQRLMRAGKGALAGGVLTGVAGGGYSAAKQHAYRELMQPHLGEMDDVRAMLQEMHKQQLDELNSAFDRVPSTWRGLDSQGHIP